jgi:hypothetical protein
MRTVAVHRKPRADWVHARRVAGPCIPFVDAFFMIWLLPGMRVPYTAPAEKEC